MIFVSTPLTNLSYFLMRVFFGLLFSFHGAQKLFGFFVGQVMKVSGGKANPQLVNAILKKKLK